MNNFGVSFSIKQCRNFEIDPYKCLTWLINECGFRRFRLMSYWNEIEAEREVYRFTELDKQISQIHSAHGSISLCIGARQPRWPENHWPEWAWKLTKDERTKELMKFIDAVVSRYRSDRAVVSYQLENEALLKAFGERPEVERKRLRQEFERIKKLDPSRPVIMTTSTSWGIPIRRPIPDIVGFSFYQRLYNAQKHSYTTAFHSPSVDRLRAKAISLLWRKPCFIHELQLEPWGPKNIWKMSFSEQMKSMSPEQIVRNISLARQTRLRPVDLWGGEWWYWCKLQGRPNIVEAVIKAIRAPAD